MNGSEASSPMQHGPGSSQFATGMGCGFGTKTEGSRRLVLTPVSSVAGLG